MYILFFKKELIILRWSTKHAKFWLGVQFPLSLNLFEDLRRTYTSLSFTWCYFQTSISYYSALKTFLLLQFFVQCLHLLIIFIAFQEFLMVILRQTVTNNYYSFGTHLFFVVLQHLSRVSQLLL